MAINRPLLPPLPGYVEIEQEGRRVYQRVSDGEVYNPAGGTLPPKEKASASEADELLDILLGVSE